MKSLVTAKLIPGLGVAAKLGNLLPDLKNSANKVRNCRSKGFRAVFL